MPAAQFRGPLEARVEFDFREWGKLQMALAGGSEHMNVLAPGAGERIAGAFGRNAGSGRGGAGGIDGERIGIWPGAASAFCGGNVDCGGSSIISSRSDTWDRESRRRM